MISCCSKYMECSKQRFCINNKHKKNCTYNNKLEDGHNFYDNDHLNRLYVLIDGSCYAVSRRNRVNILFEPSSESKEFLKHEFEMLGISYLEQYEFRFCSAEKISSKNPAYWEVGFSLGDNSYLIRNFNIRLMTEEKAKNIHEYLCSKGLSCAVYTRADSKMLSEIRVARSNENIVHVVNNSVKKSEKNIFVEKIKEKSHAEQSRMIVNNQIDMFALLANMGS